MIGDVVQKEKGNEVLQTFFVSGRSGSFEIIPNNMRILSESITPDVGIIRAYQSTGVCTTASGGTIVAYPNVYQLSSSLLLNTVDVVASRCCISYYELNIQIDYPIIDPSWVAESFETTQGFVVGCFITPPAIALWQLPLLNFSKDGKIKSISFDKNYKLMFVDTGFTWQQGTIFKIKLFCDFINREISIMINDTFISKISNLQKLLLAVTATISKTYEVSDYDKYSAPDYIFQISWLWFGSLYTHDYDQYRIYNVRCAKTFSYLGASQVFYNDAYFRLVNRFLKSNYRGNIRKLTAGSCNFGISSSDRNAAIFVSCSDNLPLQKRPSVRLMDQYAKLFDNNLEKTWNFSPICFPKTVGW
jgi:hypothetical protein